MVFTEKQLNLSFYVFKYESENKWNLRMMMFWHG
jgi:hypothetical protein